MIAAPCAHRYDTHEEALYAYWLAGYDRKTSKEFLKMYQGRDLTIRQIKYIAKKLGFSNCNRTSDNQVQQAIREELKHSGRNVGYRTMWHIIRSKGLNVSCNKLRLLHRLEDPVGVENRRRKRFKRGLYRSEGPNQTWHIDGHDKLSPFGIHISGCIDGYSRKLIWLEASKSNSDPKVIAKYFLMAVKEYQGCPLFVRADPGTENPDVAGMQAYLRRNGQDEYAGVKSFIYGKSTNNQRIEQYWSTLLRSWGEWWRQYFGEMVNEHLLQIFNKNDMSLVRFVFLDLIKRELAEQARLWNNHRIRHQAGLRVPCGIPNVLYHLQHLSDGRNRLQVVTSDDISTLDDYLQGANVNDDMDRETILRNYWQYVVEHCRLAWPPKSVQEAGLLYEYIRLVST